MKIKTIKSKLNIKFKDCLCIASHNEPNYHDHKFFVKEENGKLNLKSYMEETEMYDIISIPIENNRKKAYKEIYKLAQEMRFIS
jgi:hypothetical protein